MTPAIEQALELMDPARRPAAPDVAHGYLDLLGAEDPAGDRPGQQLMGSRVLPAVYERVWRPLLGTVLMAGPRPDRAMALQMLALAPGDRVLDAACGPGNLTRAFAPHTAGGLVVGLDASRAMLAQAVREAVPDNVAYVRGDAGALPFRDGTFQAVCCFAALYLIEEPRRALDEIVRVLAPGARLALLTSVARGPLPAGTTNAVVRPLSGVRVFGRREIVRALELRGLTGIEQRVAGFAQFVGARR